MVNPYIISKATLYHKINDYYNQLLYGILQQGLTLEKEEFIKSWVLKIQSWGFLLKVAQ